MGLLSINDSNKSDPTASMILVGEVVDTNDPQQMGRLRVRCALLGDDDEKEINQIPWAMYVSPFGGVVSKISRGPNDEKTKGPVSYGMWNIPKRGAHVIVTCIEGNSDHRIWLGCLQGDHLPHTMPSGRHTVKVKGNLPDGPYTTNEEKINPLYDNQEMSFKSNAETQPSYEYLTRGADYSVSAVDSSIVAEQTLSFSKIPDDKTETYVDGSGKTRVHRQGYENNRSDPDAISEVTGKLFDSQTYSWTTPGFHTISMDDKDQNCRIRVRSTCGNQIILDDTNERIYISTEQGKNWIEMDKNGNVDIYSERRISVHAKKDINFTTDESFRVTAKKGIHLESGEETRLHSVKDTHIKTNANLRVIAEEKGFIETVDTMNLKSSAEFRLFSSKDLSLKTTAQFKATSNQAMHLRSNTHTIINGPGTSGAKIDLNGPLASEATTAEPSNTFEAFFTNRVPEHESWGRTMMNRKKTDLNLNNSHELELKYNDKNNGKKEFDDTIERNPNWRR